MDKVLKFLKDLLSGGLVESSTKLLDEIITNKEERQILINELKKEEYKNIQVLEMIKARALEKELEYQAKMHENAVKLVTETNNSQYSSWLSRNVTAILGIYIIFVTTVIYIVVLVARLKVTESTVLLVVTNSTALASFVAGFYFGSSADKVSKNAKAVSEQIKEFKELGKN